MLCNLLSLTAGSKTIKQREKGAIFNHLFLNSYMLNLHPSEHLDMFSCDTENITPLPPIIPSIKSLYFHDIGSIHPLPYAFMA
jgi:hypothetical protein